MQWPDHSLHAGMCREARVSQSQGGNTAPRAVSGAPGGPDFGKGTGVGQLPGAAMTSTHVNSGRWNPPLPPQPHWRDPLSSRIFKIKDELVMTDKVSFRFAKGQLCFRGPCLFFWGRFSEYSFMHFSSTAVMGPSPVPPTFPGSSRGPGPGTSTSVPAALRHLGQVDSGWRQVCAILRSSSRGSQDRRDTPQAGTLQALGLHTRLQPHFWACSLQGSFSSKHENSVFGNKTAGHTNGMPQSDGRF